MIKQLFVQHFTILVLGVVARGAGYPGFKKFTYKYPWHGHLGSSLAICIHEKLTKPANIGSIQKL